LLGVGFAPSELLESVENRFISAFSQDGNGSGRNVFWGIVYNNILNASDLEFYFGHSVGAIQDLLFFRFGKGIGAHNDFLDVGFTFGVVQLLALILLYLIMFFKIFTHKAERAIKYSLQASILGLFSLSIVTGGMFDAQFSVFFFGLGMLLNAKSDDKNVYSS
jgi:O-antigen ligase